MTDQTPDALAASSPDPAAHPSTQRDVEYKGAPLDSERGPGLGCFYIQLVVLAAAVIFTPLTVVWGWPSEISMVLLLLVLLLLLLTGQTIIFLLRLVAADRRAAGRRRPLASTTKTVGELEDERMTGVQGAAEGSTALDGPTGAQGPASEDGPGGDDEDSARPA